MARTGEHVKVSASKFGFVLALFVVFIGLAHVWAEIAAREDASHSAKRDAARTELVQKALSEKQPLPVFPAAEQPHTAVYYRILFTIWVTVLLLIPAFAFYIMRRPSVTSNYWLLFWTFSYLAYLCHFYWAVFGLFEGDFREILSSPRGANPNSEKVVCNPIPDFVLTVWWGVDVLLAWFITYNNRFIQWQRGILQVVAFVMFFGATVVAPKAGLTAHLLGLAMAATVTMFLVLRTIVRRLDHGSFLGTLYVQSFVLLNKIWPWHKLPTWLSVINLGALRDVLREKNLHGTDGIPVTREEGRMPEPTFSGDVLRQRDVNGYFNDLRKPEMGSGSIDAVGTPAGRVVKSNPGARFGRNIPLDHAWPNTEKMLTPNPRLISEQLLQRDEFKPATILNLLAAAWIQFETHDWFFHGEPTNANPFKLELEPGDSWNKHAPEMVIRRTQPDPTRAY